MTRWLKILFLSLLVIMVPWLANAQVTPDTTYTTVEDDGEGEIVEAAQEATATTDNYVDQPTIYNSEKASETEWNDLVADKAFDYKNEREAGPKPEEPQKKEPTPQRDRSTPMLLKWLLNFIEFLGSTVGLVIMGIVVVGVILYIAYRVISGEGKLFAKTSKSLKDEETVVDEEDLIGSNWELKLQEAIRKNDVRMAVRYSYMLVLQMLQHRELISYRQDKTNIEYFRELETGEIKTYFRQMMRQYEYTWYGNFLPSQSAFESYLQVYDSLKIKLKSR